MAVMSTPQPEGVLLEEKPLRTAPVIDKETRNGTLEVNGHASPGNSHQDSAPKTIANHKGELNVEQNEEAFSTNQALASGPNGTDQTEDASPKEPAHEISGKTQQLGLEDGAPTDSEMVDAPAKSPTPPPEEAATNSPKDITDAPVPSAGAQVSLDTPAESPISPAISAASKEDVVMSDAQPPTEPSAAPDRAESTQDTAVSDVPAATPTDDAKASTSIAADVGQGSPAPPATADTSMSEPSQTKVARERSVDSEDEPVAKRAKVEVIADQVQVKTEPASDRMDVDKPEGSSKASQRASEEPRHLADPSLDNGPITDYMSRQIRVILGGVKKTKAGNNFKAPVRELWPALWNEYSLKVKQPVDIQSMERKLRGELTKYSTMGDFKKDLQLLVENSITFNGDFHDVTKAAKSARENILQRMASVPAVEPVKVEKKPAPKQHPTRHTEPRSAAPQSTAESPRRPPKPVAADPPPKPVVDSPAFAIPANNNGMPLIRRDSTKGDGRAKRPVKPAHPKDLVYDVKRKKKLSPELRFAETVLDEIRKTKYYEHNAAFLQPVDPVALNIPTYHKVVKKPMDLQTMAEKLNAGEYTSAKEVERDFELIVKNCRLFNGEEHTVYHQALNLQQLFKREWSKKDEWMAKHAPAAAVPAFPTNVSPVHKDESEDDDHESEAEPEVDEEQKATQQRLVTIQKRLEDEQKNVNDMINTGTAQISDVEIAQSVVAMLQKQLMSERAKLAAFQKKPAKPKPTKPKKSSGSSGPKKPLPGAAPSKKAGGAKKPPKRKMGALEKEIIAAGIAELESPQLERAIEIIKKDTRQSENDSGELELDIELLSEEALTKLYDIATKAFPHLRAEKEKTFVSQPAPEPAPPKPKAAAKPKKNKPMSKMEQERRIQQLNELRAAAGRQASGSQEPMESIEGNGNGRASVDPVQNNNADSDDEESSEEE